MTDVLIDAGTGIGDLDLADLDSIRHVFLTHAHLDHIAGLPMLADRVFDENFEAPLTVYAREETLRAVQDHLFNGVIWPDFTKLPSAENPMLRWHVCSPGDTITIGHRDFYAVDVMHIGAVTWFHRAEFRWRFRGQRRYQDQRDLVARAECLR